LALERYILQAEEKAVLVAVILQDQTEQQVNEYLDELAFLAETAGAITQRKFIQKLAHPDSKTFIGKGKLEEIKQYIQGKDVRVVIFDDELSGSQITNIEKVLDCKTIDRSDLILDIFARHARTREGQLQVELAQLEYMLPRLAGRGKSMSQLGGGIGTRGPGETQLETDRRQIQRRIDQLKQDLEAVRRVRKQQRQRRESVPVPTVALVGYTNAGKSSLFNCLTGAQVLQSPRMFATLDPKLRAIELPSRRKVLLSDTVGFIRNLPHTLVTSFRATLEEVAQAEVLLHIRDAASTYGEEQKSQVEKVLGELESLGKPRIEVLNKIDLLGEHERDGLLGRTGATGEVAVSALTGEGMDSLLAAIDAALHSDPILSAELRTLTRGWCGPSGVPIVSPGRPHAAPLIETPADRLVSMSVKDMISVRPSFQLKRAKAPTLSLISCSMLI